MAGGREIRAGRAYVEVSIRDKLTQQLKHVARRFAAFAAMVKSTSAVLTAGMRNIGKGMVFVGRSVAVAGTSILATMGLAVKTFLDVSAAAKKAGKAIAGVDAGKAERLSDALQGLRGAFTALLFRVGEALAEPLARLAEAITGIVITAARWVRENQGLVVTLAIVAAAAVALGAAVIAIGSAFLIAASAVAGISAVLTAVATPIGAVVALLLALSAAALVAGVAFVAMSQLAQTSIGGIAAALAGGNLLSAMFQLASVVKFIWVAAFEGIRSTIVAILQSIIAATRQVLREVGNIAGTISPTLGASFGGANVALGKVGAGLVAVDSAAENAARAQMMAALQTLQSLSKNAQADFARKIGVGVSAGNIALPGLSAGGGPSSGFGVAGTSSAAAAGFLRSSNVQNVSDKTSHEKLDDVKAAIEAIEATASVEVG